LLDRRMRGILEKDLNMRKRREQRGKRARAKGEGKCQRRRKERIVRLAGGLISVYAVKDRKDAYP
jgi:hypothetical protein